MMAPNFFRLSLQWTEFFFGETIYSHVENIPEYLFHAFYQTPLEDLRVLLLMEPLHPTRAFDDVKPSRPLPEYLLDETLMEFYEELKREGYSPTFSENVKHWYKQGVMILDPAFPLLDAVLQAIPESTIVVSFADRDGLKRFTHAFVVKDQIIGSGLFKWINKKLYKQKTKTIAW